MDFPQAINSLAWMLGISPMEIGTWNWGFSARADVSAATQTINSTKALVVPPDSVAVILRGDVDSWATQGGSERPEDRQPFFFGEYLAAPIFQPKPDLQLSLDNRILKKAYIGFWMRDLFFVTGPGTVRGQMTVTVPAFATFTHVVFNVHFRGLFINDLSGDVLRKLAPMSTQFQLTAA